MSDERATIKPEEVPSFLDKTFERGLAGIATIERHDDACGIIQVAAVALKAHYANWDDDETVMATYHWARKAMPRAPFAKAS